MLTGRISGRDVKTFGQSGVASNGREGEAKWTGLILFAMEVNKPCANRGSGAGSVMCGPKHARMMEFWEFYKASVLMFTREHWFTYNIP